MLPSHASQPAFDSWLSSLRRVCGSFDSQPPERNVPFHGEVGSLTTCGLEVAEIRTNASWIARRRRDVEHDDDRYCFLIVQRRGRAGIRQQGLDLELHPGEMALVDSARACEILPRGLIEHASFHMPRAELAARLPRREVPFGKLSTAGPGGQLLQLMVNRIVSRQLVGDTAHTEGEGISEALIALLVPLTQGLGQERSPEAALDLLYQGACQLIDQQLQDPDLTPASLAERLNVSLRQLYRLFEAHDDTVCRHIQRRRLQSCAEILASPGQAHCSITEIAYRWGFTDSAHFSRVFKKAYGEAPRDYRRRHCLH
ncbi:transcriptional regulator FeaR [Halomonas ramblicola]|uniref:transcriptional regulator FeaR n=1 Tax=Halomonas ramblicola TaxID=747349 RepID=UPI0025B5412B|nr:transcriptional regulator FeaR [Halomonas ramblicola]MDN3522924.1 transcriptional regulator FeaR [Halomonas ramblicola]